MTMEIQKHQKVQDNEKSDTFYQLITYKIDHFGIEIEGTLDTVICNGKQTVIDGDGFLKHGTIIE